MKVNMSKSNDFCPQTLFLYGTYKEDGTPNFGLFCWFSYCWNGEMGVMACIGGDKLTKERIKKNKIFSANLVTEAILPEADYFGNKSGFDVDKKLLLETEKGAVLDVPVLKKSPWVYELEAFKFIPLDEGEVMLCKVHNVLGEKCLSNESKSIEERIKEIRPVHTTCSTYFSWDGNSLGAWGEPMKAL